MVTSFGEWRLATQIDQTARKTQFKWWPLLVFSTFLLVRPIMFGSDCRHIFSGLYCVQSQEVWINTAAVRTVGGGGLVCDCGVKG